MTSFAISPFTMPAALAAADSLIADAVWHADPANPAQVTWLESFRRRAGLAAMPEIHRNATSSAERHAEWLKSEGWEAQVTQGTERDIFLAATLNIVAKWQAVGRAYRDGDVDRVILKHGVYTSSSSRDARPVVEVVTQHESFSFVFLQVAAPPAGPAELATIAMEMVTQDNSNETVNLDFPMVDLIARADARYMIGLQSGPNIVTQAAEQLRLELNEVGGRASAAAEVAVTRGADPRTVEITAPFVLTINRNGAPKDADKVVFAAYVDRDAWRKPSAGRI